MPENPFPTEGGDTTEKRDRLLRRLIVTFVLSAVVTFWAAVGMSVCHRDAVRIELARQEAPSSATR